MEAHSSGLCRKRKREEMNGEMKEAECFRKLPRRTLVSAGQVSVSRRSDVKTWFPHLMCVSRAWLHLHRSLMSWWLHKPHTSASAWKKPAVALQVREGWSHPRCIHTLCKTCMCSLSHSLFRAPSGPRLCWRDLWHVSFRTRSGFDAGQVPFPQHTSHCGWWVWTNVFCHVYPCYSVTNQIQAVNQLFISFVCH